MWCAASITWGIAVVGGLGVAVLRPDVLPSLGVTPGATTTVAPAGAVRPSGAPTGGATAKATTQAGDVLPGARSRAADKAVRYAEARGWRSGIAVIDLVTGDLTTAGDAQDYFHAESTVKLFIATRLLADGAMSGDTERTAFTMISASDDASANRLYAAAGGDGLVAWIGQRYKITRMGTPPTRGASQWGSAQVTPVSMARYLKAAYDDPVVSAWLVKSMLAMTRVASDGTNQVFGLKAADPVAVVKQGWGGDEDPRNVESAPSVGYVDRGRYAVAIYTSRLPEVPVDEARDVVTAQAQLLLPGGRMPRL